MQSCAVIGCGAAGMVTSAMLRQSGLLVTCFEVAAEPGGVWSSNCHETFTSRGLLSPIYPSMRCTLPKDLMSFSDVRFDFTVPHLAHHSAVRRYLERYAERKGVRGMTRFNTKVESVRFDAAARRWRVLTVNITNGDIMEWMFDKVCVCTGRTHAVQLPPTIQETLHEYLESGGEVLHTSYVKNFRLWRRKRVVVLGDDEWAHAYCNELRQAGAVVFHSLPGRTTHTDAALFPAETCVAHDASHGNEFVNLGESPKRYFPLKMWSSAAEYLATRAGLPQTPDLSRRDERFAADTLRQWLQRYYNGAVDTVPRLGPIVRCEGRGILFATLSCDPADETSGEVQSCGSKSAPTVGAVTHTCCGEFIDRIDAVICATGFRLRYPFLSPKIRCMLERAVIDPRPLLLPGHPIPELVDKPILRQDAEARLMKTRGLYLGTLFACNPTLAFIGAQSGLLPPYLLYEAQARFVAFAFSERIKLPQSAASFLDKERQLVESNLLLIKLYSQEGCGLASSAYYNVLQAQLDLCSRETYTSKLLQRRTWLALSALLSIVHKFRALAPLKRRQQHVLFSNCI